MNQPVKLTEAQISALAETAARSRLGLLMWGRIATMAKLEALGMVEKWAPPSVAEHPRMRAMPWRLTDAGRIALGEKL